MLLDIKIELPILKNGIEIKICIFRVRERKYKQSNIYFSISAVTFLEYWKRKNASLAHHWDCMGFKEEEERPRPEFAAKAPFLEKNPVTGIKEPHFPDNLRMKRVVVGTGLIFMMVRSHLCA